MGQDQPTLYSGTFERSIDAKKRVAVPASWLAQKEGEEFFVIPNASNEFLMVMPREEFARWEERFHGSGLPADQVRKVIRKFYASARQVVTDAQGRVLLPEEHCAKVGLQSAAVFLGGKSRFEIWSKDRYAATSVDDEATYMEAAHAIGL
jgi:MraZ protein